MLFLSSILKVVSSVLIGSSLISLLLETAGLKPGEVKKGKKPHIIVFAILTVLGLLIYVLNAPFETNTLFKFDMYGKLGIFFSCILFIFCFLFSVTQKKNPNRDRGENYSLLLIALLLVSLACTTTDLTVATITLTLWHLISIGLCTCDSKRRLGSEVSTKLIMKTFSWFFIMIFATGLTLYLNNNTSFYSLADSLLQTDTQITAKIALSFTLLGLFSFLGLTPFGWFHVDYLDGTPPFTALAFVVGSFVTGGIILVRILQAVLGLDINLTDLEGVLWFFASLGLLAPCFLSLDQRRITRMCIYLVMIQPALLLTMTLLSPNFSAQNHWLFFLFMTNITFSIPGVILGLNFLRISELDMTWEDYAGAGRKYPITIAAWLVSLSSLVGLPGTLGFFLRFHVIETAFLKQRILAGLIVLASIVLGAVPISRLAVFLFTKPATFQLQRHRHKRPIAVLLLCCFITLLFGFFPKLAETSLYYLPSL